MRNLVRGVWAGRISWLLVTTLLLPLTLLGGAPRAARAQLTRIPQVAVIDFGNLSSGQAGGILGRQATDAVVVEMTRTARFDVTPRSQLSQQLQDLGLTPPLNNIGIRKLGQALGVDYVATGDINSIVLSDNPRRARVSLSVRLIDVASGELANGAIESGQSNPPPAGFQPDDDALISQAISNAAYNVVQTVNNYTLPEATVIGIRPGGEVLLNRGQRDGINSGLSMVVIRGTDRIGTVRITTVGSTDSTAVITDSGKGIRPEDRARAIFELPGYGVKSTGEIERRQVPDVGSYAPQKKKGKNVFATVLGIAAAVVLLAFVTRSKSSNNGSGVSRVTARAYADLATPTQDTSAARVEVRWDAAVDIPLQQIQEFQVYRDGFIIAVTPPNQYFFIDTPTLGGVFTYQRLGANGALVDPAPTATATGLGVGVSHDYRIVVVYQRLDIPPTGTGDDDDDGTILYQVTPVSPNSGRATPIARPAAISPTASQERNLSSVSFTFATVRGANQYVIELADNPTFNNKKSLLPPLRFTYNPGGSTPSGTFDIRSSFPNAEDGDVIFYRIGARNATDSPGPLPTGVPNGDNWVYSDSDSSFRVIGQPPSPPTTGS